MNIFDKTVHDYLTYLQGKPIDFENVDSWLNIHLIQLMYMEQHDTAVLLHMADLLLTAR